LEDLGLEVVLLQNWPGFSDFDYDSIEQYTQEIVDRLEQQTRLHAFRRIDYEDDDFALEALGKPSLKQKPSSLFRRSVMGIITSSQTKAKTLLRGSLAIRRC